MPRQANGAYLQPANTAGGPAGVTISSSEYNSLEGDIGNEITNSLDRYGRGAMLSDLDAGTFRVKNVANPTASGDATSRQYVLNQIINNSSVNAQTVSGVDVITATFSPTITSYTHGMRIYFRSAGANLTSVVSLRADALPSKVIYRAGYAFGTTLSPGDIPNAGFWVRLTYDAGLNAGTGGFMMEPWDRTPTGTIKMMAAAIAPPGYLLCNGASVSRATYANLFATITTLYGSVDGSHFTLPVLGGRFPRFLDGGIGLDPGRAIGSLQSDTFQDHTHSAFLPGTTTGVTGPGAFLVPSQGFTQNTGLATTGYRAGTENRPTNIALYGIIKL